MISFFGLGISLLGFWVSEFLGSGGFLLLSLSWSILGEFSLGFSIILGFWVSEFLGSGGFLLFLSLWSVLGEFSLGFSIFLFFWISETFTSLLFFSSSVS